ncbi:MAG: protein kinase [bacterium]
MMQPGDKLAHFEIVRKLGEGGMGEVYLARDQKLNREVALKILHEDYFDSEHRRERFQREATMAARVSQSNVAAIYDIGTATLPGQKEEVSYIVMEYAEGQSLKQYMQQKRGDLSALLRVAEKVAAGVAAAHKLNVVHRDLKPENIIVTAEDEPKILDFGLAKAIAPLEGDREQKDGDDDTISKELTRAGTVVGTVSYMSPEQAQGKDVDSRSDVFSFGILLYNMFTGELPFTGKTQVSILARILETHPEKPSLKNEAIPPELERIIDKCLQKDPNDRYQDTRDLVVDLRRLRREHDSGATSTITGPTAAIKAVKPRASTSTWAAMAAGAVIILVLIAFASGLFDTGGSGGGAVAGSNGLAILGFENKTDNAELDWLKTGLPEILLTDLAQSTRANIISQSRVLDRLGREAENAQHSHSHQESVEAARALGATTILSGAFYMVGDKIRIDARLEEAASGKITHSAKVQGTDPFALVDSLTLQIAAALNVEQIDSAASPVAELTTASPEAYKHYHLGIDEFLNGRHEEAVAQFEEALKYDSTFALAYMRIGLARQFQGRPQEAAQNLALAKQYEHRLSNYDRNLLDIYADLWLKQEFDQAMTKLRTLVGNYPDDKEAKSMLAILEGELSGDTTRAFQLLDSVIEQDPGFRMALNWYADIRSRQGNINEAVRLTEQLLRYHPESYDARMQLARYYIQLSQFDKAKTAFERILESHPDDPNALFSLFNIALRQRDFKGGSEYLERVAAVHGDNPFEMISYWANKAALAFWRGKFLAGLDFDRKSLDEAFKSGDSTLILSCANTLSEYFRRFEMKDSALYYAQLSRQYAHGLSLLNYPIMLAQIDPALADTARPLFEKESIDFRARVPQEIWPLVDALGKVFRATVDQDTALEVEGMEELVAHEVSANAGNRRSLGYTLIKGHEYQRGIDILLDFVQGPDETASGYHYPHICYLLGTAYEGLGDTKNAKARYREMLKYWGNPDLELKEIVDARERLARLESSS